MEQAEEVVPLSTITFSAVQVDSGFYSVDIGVEISDIDIGHIKTRPYIMIAIECRSGLDLDNLKALKSEILNLILDFKERSVKEILLFWNDNVYEVGTLPNKDISDILGQIAKKGQKGVKEEFSYTDTLVSLRHKIVSIEKTLTKNHELSIIFFSTEINLGQLLEDASWEQTYMRWLYGRNLHREEIQLQFNKLHKKINNVCPSTTVHSIGFGKYHDHALLQRLSYISTKGCYQSATSVKEVQRIFEYLAIEASGEVLSLQVNLSLKDPNNQQPVGVKPLTIISDQKCRNYVTRRYEIFLPERDVQKIFKDPANLVLRFANISVQQIAFERVIKEHSITDRQEYIRVKCGCLSFILYDQVIRRTSEVPYIVREKDIQNENKYIYVQYFHEDILKELVEIKNYVASNIPELDEMTKLFKMGEKGSLIREINELRNLILDVEQLFADIYQQKCADLKIGYLIGSVSRKTIKNSLRKKLLKRINANPNMVADVQKEITSVVKSLSQVDIDAKYAHSVQRVGYCMFTHNNFVKAMFSEDCLGLLFQIHRPPASIADPGRIRIERVFHFPVSTSMYMSDTRFQWCVDEWIRPQPQSMSQPSLGWFIKNQRTGWRYNVDHFEYQSIGFKEQGTQFESTAMGVLPLYICEENWRIARQLMKPALGWTVCDEPLAYTQAQLQTIPFLVLESLIVESQELKYELQETEKGVDDFFKKKEQQQGILNCLADLSTKQEITDEKRKILRKHFMGFQIDTLTLNQMRAELREALEPFNQSKYHLRETQINMQKERISINARLISLVEETCCRIIKQLSGPTTEAPWDNSLMYKFKEYSQPINRTVDVIPNNLAFIAQVYSLIQMGTMKPPTHDEFHYFLLRIVEEELRRHTFAWKEEYVEESFVNKLLNVEIEKIEAPTVVVLNSSYRQRFEAARMDQHVQMKEINQKRELIQLNIKKENLFNTVQRMVLIEYKRLYETKALRFWYTRFKLYGEVERKDIHKWKSIGILDPYMIFTLVIQNKTQGRNATRRQTIEQGMYVDPFDHNACVEFIENKFQELREKVIRRNIRDTVNMNFNSDVQAFALTPDPVEAAGVLLGIGTGKHIQKFYEGLQHEKSPDIQIKLRMLLKGEYDGVRLMTHKGGWTMSKQRGQRLRKKYPREFQLYRWMI